MLAERQNSCATMMTHSCLKKIIFKKKKEEKNHHRSCLRVE
jgi:hypothetical protein